MYPKPKPGRATGARLNFVDTLRGFAALYVVIFHIVLVPDPHLPLPNWLAPIVHSGWSGVNLFFLISAFTLCYALFGRQDEPKATQKFYLRRLFRILPLYYLWLAVMVWLDWGFSGVLLRKSLYLYLFFGFNFVPGHQEGLVIASWTLGIEMVFYLLFPFIFKVVNTLKRSLIFLAFSFVLAGLHYFLIGYLSARVDMSAYKIILGLFHQMPSFAMGVVTFFVYNYLKMNDASKQLGVVLLVVGALGIIGFSYLFHERPLHSIYVMTVFYGVFFVGLFINPVGILTNRMAVFFGTISYSLYLNHPMLVNKLTPVYRYIYSLGHPTIISLIICFLITIIPLTLVSFLTYKLIEQPGTALGKRVIKKLTPKQVKKKSVVRQMEEQF